MTIKVKQPLGNVCLDCCWQKDVSPCRSRLYIWKYIGSAPVPLPFPGDTAFAVIFYGETTPVPVAYSSCCSSSSYVTVAITGSGSDTKFTAYVDVWGAYDAGLWTSSTTIRVFARTEISPTDQNVYTLPEHDSLESCEEIAVTNPTTAGSNFLCSSIAGAANYNLITITDDGSITIS